MSRSGSSARVGEHFSNLGGEGGDHGGVEQRVQPGKQNAADHHTDDNLDRRVDITLGALFSNHILNGGNGLLELGLDFVDKISHDFLSPVFFRFLFVFVVGTF